MVNRSTLLVMALLLLVAAFPATSAPTATLSQPADGSQSISHPNYVFADAGNPRWQILVLIYGNTDFAYTDSSGNQHRVVASMTQEEKNRAANATTGFFGSDVPALDSGFMLPILTIRYPQRSLTQLSPIGDVWWPSQIDTALERDSSFDSVLVIWDSSGIDQNTGQPVNLAGGYGGLALNTGTGQTYATFQIDAVASNQRNIFKHEWGHSILFYYDAAGTAPKPAVNNHINNTDTRYVHCPTGENYILVDETDDNPIPNSIYNDYSGFTHDYYSGTTATPDQPPRCLGITAQAWASGGPVTRPSPTPTTTPTSTSTPTPTNTPTPPATPYKLYFPSVFKNFTESPIPTLTPTPTNTPSPIATPYRLYFPSVFKNFKESW